MRSPPEGLTACGSDHHAKGKISCLASCLDTWRVSTDSGDVRVEWEINH